MYCISCSQWSGKKELCNECSKFLDSTKNHKPIRDANMIEEIKDATE